MVTYKFTFILNRSSCAQLLFMKESKDHASWVLPVVQGFVQYEHCVLNHLFDPIGPAAINVNT